MDTISAGISLWWSPMCLSPCPSLSSPSGPVTTALQQASCVWINLPGWLLIWRWVGRHPPTPKLISLCHCTIPLPSTPPPLTDTHACTHIRRISSSVSVSSTWKRAWGRVTSPKEKGQSAEGVHHSEVSQPLFRRADEAERKEERTGGRMGGGKRVTGKEAGGFFLCLSGYWLSAKSSSWPTELAGVHRAQINHHTVCVSPSRLAFDYILIMRKQLKTLARRSRATNGHLVAKNTPEGSKKLQKRSSQTHIGSFRNDHTMHPLHLRASGVR